MGAGVVRTKTCKSNESTLRTYQLIIISHQGGTHMKGLTKRTHKRIEGHVKGVVGLRTRVMRKCKS